MPARIPMAERQRTALLALPDTETMVARHHGLDAEDLSTISIARTPATQLGNALQLCCLRYPRRHLRASELLPAIMLDHIAEQVGVDAGVIADFAWRMPTRYDQLAAIKVRFGFTDLSRPVRTSMMAWLATEAMLRAETHLVTAVDPHSIQRRGNVSTRWWMTRYMTDRAAFPGCANRSPTSRPPGSLKSRRRSRGSAGPVFLVSR